MKKDSLVNKSVVLEISVLCSQVIKTLDPKQPVNSAPDIQALKNQLSEKERKIQHLEVDTFDYDEISNEVNVAPDFY